jgi:hypothetical protein
MAVDVSFSGGKQQGEADQLPAIIVKDINAWSYTFTSPYAFISWCLMKYRKNFIEQICNFMQAFASKFITSFTRSRDPLPCFSSFQYCLRVLKWGLLFEEKRGQPATLGYRCDVNSFRFCFYKEGYEKKKRTFSRNKYLILSIINY